MTHKIARTKQEAEQQEFDMSDYNRWVQFAHLVDGYSICEEMGVEVADWLAEKQQLLIDDPDSLSVLDLRMILFLNPALIDIEVVSDKSPVRCMIYWCLLLKKRDRPITL